MLYHVHVVDQQVKWLRRRYFPKTNIVEKLDKQVFLSSFYKERTTTKHAVILVSLKKLMLKAFRRKITK